jgi:hypothetical protein
MRPQMTMPKRGAIVQRPVESRILFIRGHKVLLDSDLAELYGVSVKRLNEQVKRNPERFPDDFMFRLTADELKVLRLQIATPKGIRGGRRYLPFVFSEHGAIMAASVLNSTRAVEMSVFVVRAFVRLREILSTHKELAAKVSELERRLGTHDARIREIVRAIRELTEIPAKPHKQIGFRTGQSESPKALKAGRGQ